MSTLTLQEQLHNAAELVQQARKIVALTGAGISTESGIPDFRSPGSIWQAAPPVSYHDFINKPEEYEKLVKAALLQVYTTGFLAAAIICALAILPALALRRPAQNSIAANR